VCRAGTVFTTHTPVAAGIDRFPRTLIEQHFSGPAGDPALPTDRVLALGAETYPGGDPEVFNMAVMGMRLAQRVNGVSRLHGRVSRAMFAGLWPGFDPDVLERGFQPFTRSAGSGYEGSGLGLALTARIVGRHGGAIWAESKPGEGATFYFTLEGGPLEPADR